MGWRGGRTPAGSTHLLAGGGGLGLADALGQSRGAGLGGALQANEWMGAAGEGGGISIQAQGEQFSRQAGQHENTT